MFAIFTSNKSSHQLCGIAMKSAVASKQASCIYWTCVNRTQMYNVDNTKCIKYMKKFIQYVPSSTPVTMDAKLSSSRIISAACLLTSDPAMPMATPGNTPARTCYRWRHSTLQNIYTLSYWWGSRIYVPRAIERKANNCELNFETFVLYSPTHDISDSPNNGDLSKCRLKL